jgi:hypothetical protein
MGRQYALTLSFAENEAGGPVGVKFQLEVEDWDGKTEEAYAATTVVFNDNRPSGVSDGDFTPSGITDNTCSKFIHGQSIATTTGGDVLDQAVPILDGYIFQGYFDSREGGTQYFVADADGHLIVAAPNGTFNGTNWDKAGPSCTLYAHWADAPNVWAASNIYFRPDIADGVVGSLTFAKSDQTKSGYQGLHFKWGSLIGVAAYPTGEYNNNDTYLYIPDVNTGKYYKVHAGAVSAIYDSGMDDMDKAVRTYAKEGGGHDGSWNSILSATDTDLGGSVATGRDKSPLTDASGQPLYSPYKGDICKFLSDKSASKLNRSWMMPISNDFDGNYTKSPSWNNTVTATATPENGTNVIPDAYYKYTTASYEEVTFPASGYRYNDVGALGAINRNGYYWGSSVNGTSSAYSLFFFDDDDDLNPARPNDDRAWGRSVRCVQNY